MNLAPTASRALRAVSATRYVTALREGGSLPGLTEADDDGLYVVKFRGAGQGAKALVAEVIVGELARALGLLIPELVAVEVEAALGAAEPDPEIQDLIVASAGINLGVDFLPGALAYVPGAGFTPEPAVAADVVWLDALTTNVDRTPRNPNLLVWHGRMWLIDHGAALYLHHQGLDPERDGSRAFPLIAEHVLLPHAASIADAHARLSGRVSRDLLARIAGLVPADWLGDTDPETYVEYLERRVQDGAFAEEAERARVDP